MLTDTERAFITDLLLAKASAAPNAKQYLLVGLYDHLRYDFADAEPRVLVNRAIELCVADRYQRDPSALAYLLKALLFDYDRIPEIAERVKVAPPVIGQSAGMNPFDATVLDTRLPFIGRKDARSFLRAWAGGAVQRQVAVINGAAKLGKTYTAEFIDHLSNHLSSVRHCVVVLEPQQGASTGAPELARDIVVRMGGKPEDEPPAHTNSDRWTVELANWVMSVAASSPHRWCFVLDGFNNRELRDDTGKFINALSALLGAGVHKGRHCLMLLDFDRTLLKLAPGRIGVETLQGLPASDVTAFVAAVINGSAHDPAVIGAKVLDGLGDPIHDLPELGQRLGDLVSVLGEGA